MATVNTIPVLVKVTNLGGGLDPKFCTVTLINAASGHTMVNTDDYTLDGTAPESSGLIANVFFDEKCGWTFDHWTIETIGTDGTNTSVMANATTNPYRLYLTLPASSDMQRLFVEVYFRVYGTYTGTGKIMRSYVDSSKLLRIGNSLVRDA